jgi:hypothetical protein
MSWEFCNCDALQLGQPTVNPKGDHMSGQPSKRPEVPEGKSRYLLTRQKKPNDKGFVGYDTIWEPFQKVAEYTKPKRP